MGIITLDLGLYGATVVLFHIISVVHLWLGIAMGAHLHVIEIDPNAVATKEQLLDRLGEALELGGPSGNHVVSDSTSNSGWGRNWDALADSLCYLDSGGIWGTSRQFKFPMLLALVHSKTLQQRDPKALETLVEILVDTKNTYASHSMNFEFAIS